MKIIILFFLQIAFFFSNIAQTNCDFQTMSDTTICSPSEIELWVRGTGLKKVNWKGEGITGIDTLKKVRVNASKTTTYHVTNRILDAQNLIINGGFELGNQSFTSNYWSSCYQGSMPQGSYCISPNTNTFWSTWKSCNDRKNPGTGNMFVTDGAIVADEEIWCQTVNVNQNTKYALSAWIAPVLNLNNAVLQFTINSDTIGKPFKARPQECQWNEFFEIWNSELNTSAKICITNQNKASNGNDFAMDDISLNKVCFQEDSIRVTVINPVVFELNKDTSICPGDEFEIQANYQFSNSYSYEWSTGETSNKIIVTQPDDYSLIVTHTSGCYGKDEIKIEKEEDPMSKLFNDTTICFSAKKSLILDPGDSKWSVWKYQGETDTAETLAADAPGVYQVTMFNGQNCFVSDRLEIKNFCATELFVPNAFTPNGDKVNDTFGPDAVETYHYHLKIINRFGKIVFESFDLSHRWSGENAPEGVYVYHLDYRQVTRENQNLVDLKKIGTVTLIR